MTRTPYRIVATLAVLAFIAMDSVATAQVIRRPFRREVLQPVQPGTQATQGNSAQSQSNPDSFLASWLGTDNQNEIALSQLAEQRASNQDVKNFAQQMVKDHTDLANRIQQAVGSESAAAADQPASAQERVAGFSGNDVNGQTSAAITAQSNAQANAAQTPATNPASSPAAQETAPATPSATQGNAVQQNATGATAVAPATFAIDPLRIKREIAQQCLATGKQELGQKQGADFDKAYIGCQIAGHNEMIATLTVAKNYASPQLRPVLDQALSTAQHHLEEAKSIMAKLDQHS